jgi:hypothetical protein
MTNLLAKEPSPPFTMGQIAWLTDSHNPNAVRMLEFLNKLQDQSYNDAYWFETLKELIDRSPIPPAWLQHPPGVR